MAADPSSTHYIPLVSPPTPAPSPRLTIVSLPPSSEVGALNDPAYFACREFTSLPPQARRRFLSAILSECSPSELLLVSTTIAPLLKRDFLRDLPPEVALHVLSFIDDPRTLVRASRVCRYWKQLLDDKWIWRRMCLLHNFRNPGEFSSDEDPTHIQYALDPEQVSPILSSAPIPLRNRAARYSTGSVHTVSVLSARSPSNQSADFSYRKHFVYEYATTTNWLRGGKLLRTHRIPLLSATPQVHVPQVPAAAAVPSPPSAFPTSVALDRSWIVVGLANSRIHVFSARTGVLSRTLVGHDSGVWAVALVTGGGQPNDIAEPEDNWDPSKGTDGAPTSTGHPPGMDHLVPPSLRYALGLDSASGTRSRRRSTSELFPEAAEAHTQQHRGRPDLPGKPSDPSGASDGWGQPNSLVVSGGCDKELRVWDVKSGYCIYVLRGHTSTIRCLKVLHGRPLAVSGSRDRTVRVWDVQRGRLVRVFEGHEQSVRCIDVCGNRVVSGSYDCTCRVWDVDTGACLHVLRGHFHQIYSVAFDGVRIASGGLDTTVRVWDAASGTCLALLQGHMALVCQLQLLPTMLVTGGSDGRVITFSLGTSFGVVQRLAAHDSSVTGLQLDERFLVTSGNDGRVRLFQFEPRTGKCEYVRELSEPSENVWKVVYTRETCVVTCRRAGKTMVEIWSFKPPEGF
ncbi:WD40 repeat-like protein [Amylocystis lapponica]|nr:WD40 repeat-like protein [Amylocystis lapponica]